MAPLNEYERARAERIAANNAKMMSLGLSDAARQLQATAEASQPARPKAAPRKRKLYEIEVEVRRCRRLQGEMPEYNEEALADKALGIDRLDLICRPRRRRVGIEPTQLCAIRERRIKEVDGEEAEVPRGPIDSGLGVRIQGGRVYDSKYGVTCHWCRQKTLEEHVTCTHPDCGGGRRLPVSFCKLCLKNRHGEDIAQAEASGQWVCPRCRGSCGEGCTTCCNCGPCRKAAGLAPTHQIINLARAAGFDNVHDYLVHQKTGESADQIAERKRQAAWGAWLDIPFDPAAAAEQEEEAEAAEPAAAAARLQPRRRSGGTAPRAAAVPEGAGGAALLYAALRWHLLASRFCAALQALAAAPKPGRTTRRSAEAAAPAAEAPAAPTQQPTKRAAAAKPAAKPTAKAAAKAAGPRRSGRRQQQQQKPAALPTKVTAFFKPAAPVSAAKAAQQAAAAEPVRAGKVAAAEALPRTRSNRLGMRARR
ncbi:hypothetical protein ABPG75_008632 [Micractinium tetrahymenae]